MSRNMFIEPIKQAFPDEDTGSLEKCLNATKPKVDGLSKSIYTDMKDAKNKITELAELHHNTVQKPAAQAGEKELDPNKAKQTIRKATLGTPKKGPSHYAKAGTGK
jgi:hypothetical protein